ncbi:MAG: autotransporter domain-containing protein [Rickettsiales bacterium]|jgi:predicted outer membrane repeat protein|nr:autotransporter domain-containing protein [Rickettsiales bacterium]
MSILGKKKIYDLPLVNFVTCFGVVVMIVFGAMDRGRATSIEVHNHEQLREAINAEKITTINIKEQLIDFSNVNQVDREITIRRDDITISGLTNENGEAASKLQGSESRIFVFAEDLKNVYLKNLIFDAGYNAGCQEDSNKQKGGAIYFPRGVKVILDNVTFSNNKIDSQAKGAAIYSEGNADVMNNLIFKGKTIFSSNLWSEGVGDDIYGTGAVHAVYSNIAFEVKTVEFEKNIFRKYGGAIYAEFSNLTFDGETIEFMENTSYSSGGAIYSKGTAANRNIIVFNGRERTIFSNNKSEKEYGGAIYAKFSDLTFDGKTTEFKGNISADYSGGAIYFESVDELNVDGDYRQSNAIFNGQVTFEENESNYNGGAIYAKGNVSIKFNGGLRLINNTTNYSGAIHICSLQKDRPAIVTIVQNNPYSQTEFRGNKTSEYDTWYDRRVCIAILMEGYSRLNFIIEKDNNVDIFEFIEGKRLGLTETEIAKTDNIVIIEGEGWFNLRKGSSLRNVNLINRGNISMVGAELSRLKLVNFTNSGKIKFEIFPNRCDTIVADSIILEKGTVLEILLAKGNYRNNNNYTFLFSSKITINTNDDSNILPIVSPQGIRIRGRLAYDAESGLYLYKIIIPNTIIKDNPKEMNLFSNVSNLSEEQLAVVHMLSNIYIDNPNDEDINSVIDSIYRLSSHEDIRAALTQIHHKFLADVISGSLIFANGEINRNIVLDTVIFEPHYKNNRLARELKDNVFGVTMGIGRRLGMVDLGFYGVLDKHSLRGDLDNEANIGRIAAILQLEAEIVRSFSLAINLSYGINSYKVNRNIEKLEKTANSNFFANTMSIAIAVKKKIKIENYLILSPYLAVETSLLTSKKFSEKNAEILNLAVNNGNFQMTTGILKVDLTLDLAKLKPFVSIGAKYFLSNNSSEISASLAKYSDYGKLRSTGVKIAKIFGSMAIGFSYELDKHLSLSMKSDCQFTGNYSSFGLGFTAGYSF